MSKQTVGQEVREYSYTPIDKGQFTLETKEREVEFEQKRGHGNEDDYKEYRRRWHELPKGQTVADFPLHVDIELASICNLKCPMCYTITEEFKSKVNTKLMDFELYKRIVDQCAEGGAYSIRLSLRGESFLHPKIIECVKYAKDKGIKEVSTLTNGVRLDESKFKEIMEAGIDWITISFDGLGETYEKIRRPAKFDRAVEKIRNYKKIKEDAQRVKPVIKVQTIFPAIAENPKAYYDVFSPITDMVSSNPLIDYLQKDGDVQIEYVDNFSCPQLYQRLVIGADGLVMLCANDEENQHVIGNANFQLVKDIWKGEPMRRAREAHKIHLGVQQYSACKKCYLPRKTTATAVQVGSREVIAENYTNRSQVVGT